MPEDGQRLCFACHRPDCGKGFAHLDKDSVDRAVNLVAEKGSLPTRIIREFRPGSDCIHFIVWAKKYWGKEFVRWLLTSVDTDLWMIVLLAMSTGHILAEGEQVVDVSVCKVTGGVPKYIWVNRVLTAICDLKDGGESAWPEADFAGWVPDREGPAFCPGVPPLRLRLPSRHIRATLFQNVGGRPPERAHRGCIRRHHFRAQGRGCGN